MRVGAVWAPGTAARSHAGRFERARRTRTCEGHQVCSQQHSQHRGAVSMPCTPTAIRPRERLGATSGRCVRARVGAGGHGWPRVATGGHGWAWGGARARSEQQASPLFSLRSLPAPRKRGKGTEGAREGGLPSFTYRRPYGQIFGVKKWRKYCRAQRGSAGGPLEEAASRFPCSCHET